MLCRPRSGVEEYRGSARRSLIEVVRLWGGADFESAFWCLRADSMKGSVCLLIMGQPEISFIVPHRNHGKHLDGCIRSCLSATSLDLEVIVIDDLSDDGSEVEAMAWTSRDSRVRVLRNEVQLGVEATVNRGLDLARGEFVVFRAADDLCLPDFFDEAVEALRQYPDAAYCLGDIRFFVDDPGRGRVESMGICERLSYVRPERWNKDFGGEGLTVAASLIRREAALGVGGMDAELRWLSDWAMMAELGFSSGMVYLPKPSCAMMIHGASYNSAGSSNLDANRRASVAMLERLARRGGDFVDLLEESRVLGFFRTGLEALGEVELSEGAARLLRSALARRPVVRKRCGMPRAIDVFLSENVEEIREASGVAILGVGGHTRLMLGAWRERGSSLPRAVVSSGEPGAETFEGILWLSAAKAREEGFDLVVLSSKSYESELAKLAGEYFPLTKVLRVWG